MRRGFTLIELLISTTLAALLLYATSLVFQAATSARSRVREHAQQDGALRRTFAILSRDMHSATVPPDDSGMVFGLTTGASRGSNVLQFAAVVGEPLLAGRAVNETVLIQYAITEDPRTGRPTLWRHETPYPVPDGGNPGSSEDTRSMPLLPGITGATYLFYSEAQSTWLESWEGETGLPTAIRVDLLQETQGAEEPRQQSWTFSLPAARGETAPAEDTSTAL